MTIPTVYEDRIDPVWEAFARRQAGNPFLELDTLYALTEPIIDAIQANVCNFFTADQKGFERDLARTASFGFFYQRPLGRAASPAPENTDQPSLAERQRRSIEGHTRTGALAGLVESGWLPGESLHDIWLASRAETPDPDTTWQQVLREERMPFVDWLIYRVPDDGPLGEVSFKVLSATCDEEFTGDDLAAVMKFIAGDSALAQYADLVREAHPVPSVMLRSRTSSRAPWKPSRTTPPTGARAAWPKRPVCRSRRSSASGTLSA